MQVSGRQFTNLLPSQRAARVLKTAGPKKSGLSGISWAIDKKAPPYPGKSIEQQAFEPTFAFSLNLRVE